MAKKKTVAQSTLKDEFIKRLQSLAWRAGSMIVVGIIAFALDNADVLSLTPAMVAFLGLVSGEVTKFIANKNK